MHPAEIALKRLKENPLTKEDRRRLLVKAKILTEDGDYHPDFFSEETILRDKLYRQKKIIQ